MHPANADVPDDVQGIPEQHFIVKLTFIEEQGRAERVLGGDEGLKAKGVSVIRTQLPGFQAPVLLFLL